MLYPGIDQHARQITISLRNDGGEVVLARQVSTRSESRTIDFRPLAWVEVSLPPATHLGHRKSLGQFTRGGLPREGATIQCALLGIRGNTLRVQPYGHLGIRRLY